MHVPKWPFVFQFKKKKKRKTIFMEWLFAF